LHIVIQIYWLTEFSLNVTTMKYLISVCEFNLVDARFSHGGELGFKSLSPHLF
jgi:hypothetical protein